MWENEKKEGNLHCKCESFYQEFLTLDIIMASESEYIFKLNWLYLLLMLLFPQMCCIMIMQFIVKKFFTFPKGSKFLYIFLMRGRRHRNMRFGNSKRYITIKIYKQHDSWIKRKKISFHASFTPWPDVSKRFITKQTKESEKLATKHTHSIHVAMNRASFLLLNFSIHFSSI